ncbi:MAG: NADH-quinone oxidoreductase subunit A [Myxococcota bacterium]
MDPNYAPYVPVVVCTILVIGLAATILILNRMLGPRRPNRVKGIPYESGVDPIAKPRNRFSVKFYMTAMLFLIFDLEVVFIYPWATRYKSFLADESVAGIGFWGMMVFVSILSLGLLYEWKRGAMDWE